jgi:hypothetical protein
MKKKILRLILNIIYLIAPIIVLYFFCRHEIQFSNLNLIFILCILIGLLSVLLVGVHSFSETWYHILKRITNAYSITLVISTAFLLTFIIYKLNYHIPLKTDYYPRELSYARTMINGENNTFVVMYEAFDGLSDYCVCDSSVCWNNDSILVKESIGIFGIKTNQREFKLWKISNHD